MQKPKANKDEEIQNRFYEKLPLRDIADVLRFVDQGCDFLSAFTHIQPRYSKQPINKDHVIATIIAQGMNNGNLNMAAISDIPYKSLHDTLQSRIRLATLKMANDMITATNANNVTINQLWLADLVSQTVEFGWWTWGGYAPYLFAYSTNSGYKNAPVSFTSASGTPFPANQPGNYHQTLSLYYIVASKGPRDSFCGGDPAGCYALEVATTLLGVRTSDFWLVGWYSKSNYVYQNFTNFETGLEIHSGGVSEPAFGTIYNAGTNLTQNNEQDFNLQSFGQVPGVTNTWNPSFTQFNINFPASMTFGGTYDKYQFSGNNQ